MSRRFLLISNFYPPHVKGGAELACYHLACWLARHGHSVGVLTLAPPGEADSTLEEEPGLTVYRRRIPNVYNALEHLAAPKWKKPIWHVIDHFNSSSAKILRDVIAEFRPEIVNTHNVSGMGYNMWQVLGDAGLPVLVACHDLTLLCLRQSMFKKGENCGTQCAICRVSSTIRGRYVRSIERLLFVSPSRALLSTIEPHFPPQARRGVHLPYPLEYPRREEIKPTGSVLQIIYVGQVSPHKGVPFMLEILDSLPQKERFHVTVVGRGASLESLQEKYANQSWVTFAGFVAPEEVDGHMRQGDLLVVPSLWYENQPLVVLQGRVLSIPLMVSDQGGLPELVEDGAFGRVIAAGDRVAWRAVFNEVTLDFGIIDRWKKEAFERRREFTPDPLGQRFVDVASELAAR